MRSWTPVVDPELGSDRAPVLVPLLVLVSCALLVLMQLYLAIPLASTVGAYFGGHAAAALGTSFSLAYAAGFLVFGPVSDRYGRKVVVVPGLIALTLTTAALAVATSLPMIAVLRSLQGFISASFTAVALAYVGEALPRRWRPTGIGAIATALLVSGILGQVYAQAVALALGWRWVFGIAAAVFALATVALTAVIAEPPREPSDVTLAQRFRQLGTILRRRDLALVYAATLTVLLSFVAMYAALGPLLHSRFGFSDTDVLLVRLAGLPAMVLAPFSGWLAGRFGAVRVAATGFLLAAAGLAAEALSVNVAWALILASAVFVAGVATVIPAVIGLVAARAGASRGGALGLSGLAAFTGASFGQLVVELPLGFTALMLVLAALLAAAAALVSASAPR